MPVRFQSIGFCETTDEASLRRTLSLIAQRSAQDGPRSLVCRPFDGCSIRIGLDADAEPERVSVLLEPPVQSVLFHSAEGPEDGQQHLLPLEGGGQGGGGMRPAEGREARVLAFSCLDGKPVSPLCFLGEGPLGELEPGSLCFAELSGFVASLEAAQGPPDDVWLGEPDSRAVAPFEGLLLRYEPRENSITGETVTLATVWLPALLLPLCARGRLDLCPGTKVRGSAHIYGTVSDRAL